MPKRPKSARRCVLTAGTLRIELGGDVLVGRRARPRVAAGERPAEGDEHAPLGLRDRGEGDDALRDLGRGRAPDRRPRASGRPSRVPPRRSSSPSSRRWRPRTRLPLTYVPLRDRPSSATAHDSPTCSSSACTRETRSSQSSARSTPSPRPMVSRSPSVGSRTSCWVCGRRRAGAGTACPRARRGCAPASRPERPGADSEANWASWTRSALRRYTAQAALRRARWPAGPGGSSSPPRRARRPRGRGRPP